MVIMFSLLILCTLLGSLVNPIKAWDDIPGEENNRFFYEIFETLGNNPELLEPVYKIFPEEVRHILKTSSVEATNYSDNSAACQGCISLVGTVNSFLRLGFGFGFFRPTLIATCMGLAETAGLIGDIICPGYIDSYGPHGFFILDERRPRMSGRYVCQGHNICDRDEVYAESTTQTKPASRKIHHESPKTEDISERKDTLTLAVLTDIHVDEKYFEGAGASQCGLMICCREGFMGQGTARRWGEYFCNAPPSTTELFMQKAAEFNPDFVIYGGDSPPHAGWEETLEIQLTAGRWVAEAFARNMPGRNVFPTIGNHETYPANLYYTSRPETQDLNFEFYDMWRDTAGFTAEQLETISHAGYYTILVQPGLRIVNYNSNYGYTFNWYNYLNEIEDEKPAMYAFVEQELSAARENGEKVILLGHHPTGGSDSVVEDGVRLAGIISEYSDVIVLMPRGHTHSDEFFVVRDPVTREPKGTFLVGQTMNTYTRQNPSFRIYHIDPDTFEVLDYDHYNIDIQLQEDDSEPEVRLLYSARSAYGLYDLSPDSWFDLANRFQDDDALFQQFYQNRNGQVGDSTCTGNCKRSILCRITNSDYVSYRRCVLGFD